MNKGKIDFIGVGAEKSGTTWLADMLRQHAQIFIPEQKELHYFNRSYNEKPTIDNMNFDQPLSWYLDFFAEAKQNQIAGELTPAYLWDEEAPKRIKQEFPEAKLIFILREPVSRAFSQFTYYQQRAAIDAKLDFITAIEKHPYLLERSKYGEQLQRYFQLFDRSQMLIMFFEDIKRDNAAFLKQVELFLGVDEFIPENINDRSNVTGVAKYPFVNKILFQTRFFLRKYKLDFITKLLRKSGVAAALEDWRNNQNKVAAPKVELSSEERAKAEKMLNEDKELLRTLLNGEEPTWLS